MKHQHTKSRNNGNFVMVNCRKCPSQQCWVVYKPHTYMWLFLHTLRDSPFEIIVYSKAHQICTVIILVALHYIPITAIDFCHSKRKFRYLFKRPMEVSICG